MHLFLPRIDIFSLVVGIVTASIIIFGGYLLRPVVHATINLIKTKLKPSENTGRKTSSFQDHYFSELRYYIQDKHLAGKIFPFDEIVIPPSIMFLPRVIDPGKVSLFDDGIIKTIPYIPNFPELSAEFNSPSITLPHAISNSADLLLIGRPGTGKSTALFHLASELSKEYEQFEQGSSKMPFYLHVGNLIFPDCLRNPLEAIAQAITYQLPNVDHNQLKSALKDAITIGSAYLLLDGPDELPVYRFNEVVEFIRLLKSENPKLHIITTGSLDYSGGLISINFIPCTISAWNSEQRFLFHTKWQQLWENCYSILGNQETRAIDSSVIFQWLNEKKHQTPIELTLLEWGYYAEDLRGGKLLDVFESHFSRFLQNIPQRNIISVLAYQVLKKEKPYFTSKDIRDWIKQDDQPLLGNNNPSKVASSNRSAENQSTTISFIENLVDNNLIVQYKNDYYGFTHQHYIGYLAKELSSKEEFLITPSFSLWNSTRISFHFLSMASDVSAAVESILTNSHDPLFREIFNLANGLINIPSTHAWRRNILVRLMQLLKQKEQPINIRCQALVSLLLSGDEINTAMLRNLCEESDPITLQLAALGIGFLEDGKSVDVLGSLLRIESHRIQQAACLALIRIGTKAAVNFVVDALLHGTENLRRSAAEALANLPDEGHAILKEGIDIKDDLLIRRSVIFGLYRIKEPWVDDLLNRLVTQDDQWAVRNAALEALENRKQNLMISPMSLPSPADNPWLVEFASRQGMGISPSSNPVDILLTALKHGSTEEKMASLNYLREYPSQGVIGSIYSLLYSDNLDLQDAAHRTLEEIAMSGMEIPDPVQFGYRV